MLRKSDLNRIFLTDLKCRPLRNDTHVVFRTGLTSCGTKFEKTHLGLRYSNVVVRSLLRNKIIRPLFRFSCYFRVINPDVDSPKAGQIKVQRPDENVNFVMVYTDEFGNIIKGNPMQTEAIEGKPVFLRISTDRRLKRDRFLVVEKCDIISLNRRKSYSLINQGYVISVSSFSNKILYVKQSPEIFASSVNLPMKTSRGFGVVHSFLFISLAFFTFGLNATFLGFEVDNNVLCKVLHFLRENVISGLF